MSMIARTKLLMLITALFSVFILVACSQTTASPTPVEEANSELSLFSPTDIVPTRVSKLSQPTDTTPTSSPTPSPTYTATTTPTEAAAGFCDPVLEMEAFAAINDRRVTAGMEPLTIEEKLNAAARRYSEDMGLNGAWNHLGSDGTSPYKRIHDAGYYYVFAAENISAGHNRGIDAVEAWMNSDGHRINMLNPEYIHMGISCFHKPDDSYTFYWAAIFATP